MTVAQWMNARRVDHATLLGFHPRVRGQAAGAPNLKVFDADVAAFAAADNDFDRVSALERIIRQARVHLNVPANNALRRYTAAINALYQSASLELGQICGAAYQPSRNIDLAALAAHNALAPRNLSLNVFYLAPVGAAPAVGPIDAVINNHIQNANNAAGYQAANITFARTNPAATVAAQTAAGDSLLLPAIPAVPVAHQGAFADGGVGGPRLITYCNASGGAANSIDVVYLDRYDQPDVQGRTFRAGANYNGAVPARSIVTVTLNPPPGGAATYPTTLGTSWVTR